MTQLGMNSVGEIDRGRPSRQFLNLARRGEYVDLIPEDIGLEGLNETRPAEVFSPFHELPQPGYLLLEAFVRLSAFLISPVGRHPVFVNAMHVVSSNLYLQQFAFERYHRGVERLIHVCSGVSNVVIELSGQRMPEVMNNAQGVITIGDLVNKDAKR
ncbi:MAG: hypothetical protein DDT28_01099 [Dehalococcoidia bacterium]|nr:hypothetical protein [Chloroflexota bacterium]